MITRHKKTAFRFVAILIVLCSSLNLLSVAVFAQASSTPQVLIDENLLGNNTQQPTASPTASSTPTPTPRPTAAQTPATTAVVPTEETTVIPIATSSITEATASASESTVSSVTPRPTYDPNNPQILQDLFLYAETGVLIEEHSGKVLYNMKAEQRMQPASITKTMTLLVALENSNLDDKVTVGSEILQVPGDSSKVPLMQGEELEMQDLLYGLMLKSGNDAAMTIAVNVAGSVEEFVALMNKKAEELGCQDTHFMNPHGYEDPNHYTTAMDMAFIAQAGMKNPDFRKIVGTATYVLNPNNVRKERYTLHTTNQFVGREEKMKNQYEYGTGIKTGYFQNAQHTFIASATKDNVDLIAVVMKSTQQGKWNDAKRLMEYGFSIMKACSVDDLYSENPISIMTVNGEIIDQSAITDSMVVTKIPLDIDSTNYPKITDETEIIDEIQNNFSQYSKFETVENMNSPIKQGDQVGTLTVTMPDANQVIQYPLRASMDAPFDAPAVSIVGDGSSESFPVIPIIIAAVVFLIVVLILIKYIHENRKWKRQTQRRSYYDD